MPLSEEEQLEVRDLIEKLGDKLKCTILIAVQKDDDRNGVIAFSGTMCPACVCEVLVKMMFTGQIQHAADEVDDIETDGIVH